MYELDAACAHMDMAIHQTEQQLVSVEKKLKDLWHDLIIYIGMATVPELVYRLCTVLNGWMHLLLPFGVILAQLIRCVYFILVPFAICHIVVTIYLLRLNREDAAIYTEPRRLENFRGSGRQTDDQREPSFRSEQKKLTVILSRYYMSKETLDQLRRRITDPGEKPMTMAELKTKLNEITYYADVVPADIYQITNMSVLKVVPTFFSFLILIIYMMWIW